MNEDYLAKQYEYYLDNITELSKKHLNKYIVIRECEVIGSYDTFETALKETVKQYDPGTFIIQKCTGTVETQTFHSRVSFPTNESRS